MRAALPHLPTVWERLVLDWASKLLGAVVHPSVGPGTLAGMIEKAGPKMGQSALARKALRRRGEQPLSVSYRTTDTLARPKGANQLSRPRA